MSRFYFSRLLFLSSFFVVFISVGCIYLSPKDPGAVADCSNVVPAGDLQDDGQNPYGNDSENFSWPMTDHSEDLD